MNRKHLYFLFLLFVLPIHLFAQLPFFNINNSPLDTIPCNDDCIVIETTHIPVFKTDVYTNGSIPYTPTTLNGGSSITLQDDKFSSVIPIGFTFCFYGSSYTSCYVSSNGHITFNSIYNNGICSDQTQTPLPYITPTFPNTAIFLPMVDMDITAGGSITYSTVGTAPFRKFIVKYSNIPYFGTLCPNNLVSMQCELNETYNTIDVFVASKPTCNSDPTSWLNYATLGIQSASLSNYSVVSGHNASIWTATNQGWRFYPSGAPATQVDWFDEANNQIRTNKDTIHFCSYYFPRTLTARITYDCPSRVFWDTINIIKVLPTIDSVLIDSTTCINTPDGGITIMASSFYPPLQYKIDGGAWSNSNVFTNLSYGFHTIYVKDALGCVVSQIIIIGTLSTLSLLPPVVVPSNCAINNGSICVQATGGVPPYTYSWGSNCIYNLPGGVYSVTVTDSVGCSVTQSIAVQEIGLPQLSFTTVKSECHQNGSIDLTVSGGVPPYTYLWSNSSTTQDISNLTDGAYLVLVTDSVGCQSSAAIYVSDTLSVALNMIDTVQPHCGLNNGELTVFAYNGLAPYHFAWSSGDTTSTAINLAPGTYTCTVTAANNCTQTIVSSVNPSSPLNLTLGKANTHCGSLNNGFIYTFLSNGAPPFTYLWSTNDTTSLITGLTMGSYSITVMDSLGCIAQDSAIITNDGSPSFTSIAYTPPLCYGDSNGFVTLTGTGGVTPYKYSVDGTNTWSTVATLTGLSEGIYTIYIKDGNSCLRDTVVYFNQPTKLVITKLTKDTIQCFQDENAVVDIFANGGTSPYVYQINSSGYQPTSSFTNLGAGIYTVYVKDSHDCTVSSTGYILGPSEPLELSKEFENIDCYEKYTGKIALSPSGGWGEYTIQWQDASNHDFVRSGLDIGTYVAIVTDSLGCSVQETTTLADENCCHVVLPNVFSPNSDGKNDIFRPISDRAIQDQYLMVYNRWGNRVFESDDFSKGWDGNLNEGPADAGTYFYLYSYTCNISGKKIILKGDITLIR